MWMLLLQTDKMQSHAASIAISPARQYRTIGDRVQSDELMFLRLGQSRQRLRTYVREQLMGESGRRNEKILLKFQQEAQIRRHNYLPKFNPTKLKYQQRRQQTNNCSCNDNLMNPQLQQDGQPNRYRSRFAGYVPGAKPRKTISPRLIPTQKAKPPAYNYYNLLPYRSFDQSISKRLSYNPQTIPFNQCDSFDEGEQKQSRKRVHSQHARAVSLDFNARPQNSHRSWALRRIKQVALRKRDLANNQKYQNERESVEQSQGSDIIQQLQSRQGQYKLQCEGMGGELKKLKKYRRLIVQAYRGQSKLTL